VLYACKDNFCYFLGVSDELTLAEWLQKYIAGRTGIRESTRYSYRCYVAALPDALAQTPLTEVTRADIGSWINQMERRWAASTLRKQHTFLSGGLGEAVRDGLIPVNPAIRHRLPRALPRTGKFARQRALTPAQFRVLTEQFTEHWRPMLRFLVASGVRFNEATALTPDDVNRDTGKVNIGSAFSYIPGAGYRIGPTKSLGSDRVIHVSPELLAELDYSHEFLFTSTRGNPVQSKSFHQDVWTPAVRRADLGFRPRIHDLRHTCATWMIADGVDPKVVQEQLGHESIRMTMEIYAHAMPTQQLEAARKMRDILANL
jgi:integrase